MKRKLLFAAALVAGALGFNANAQSEAEYQSALAAITDGNYYQVYTTVGDNNYYLKSDGKLTANKDEAYNFQFKAENAEGTLYETGWNLGDCNFSNPNMSNGNIVNGDGIRIDPDRQNRNSWERQVFFLGENGKYAVRATNSTSTSWGANSYWTVLTGPKAGYASVANYVWQLEDVTATEDDYEALDGAIEDVEPTVAGKTLGFDKGEYAPYKTPLYLLTVAKAINKDVANLKTTVNAITQALLDAQWVANTEEMDAVYDGTFGNATNDGAPLGWRMSNNTLGGEMHARAFVNNDKLTEFNNNTNSGFYVRFDGTSSDTGSMYYYGDTEGYTMPLKADTYYTVSLDFKNWNNTASKPLRLNVAGPSDYKKEKTVNSASARAENDNNAPTKLSLTFKTEDEGDYVISLQCPGGVGGLFVVSNITLKRTPIVTIDEEEDYTPSNATADVVELKRTIKEGINTIVLPFDVKDVEGVFGEGSTVYVVKSYADGNISFEESANGIEANVPCLLDAAKATDGKGTYTFENVTLVAEASPKAEKDGVSFIGTYAPTTLNSDSYVVSNNMLYLVDSKVNVKSTRAYFTVEGASEAGVKSISMSFGDDATGIVNVATSEAKSGKIYDLQGREVKNPARGIYIIDGKKVFLNK